MSFVIRSKSSDIIFEDRMIGPNLGKEIKYETFEKAERALIIFKTGFPDEDLYIKETEESY